LIGREEDSHIFGMGISSAVSFIELRYFTAIKIQENISQPPFGISIVAQLSKLAFFAMARIESWATL